MKIEKVEKLVANLHDGTEYVIRYTHKKLKTSIKSLNSFQKKFIESLQLIKMLGYFFKLMNNAGFRKTMENVRKYRVIKVVTTERRRNYLVSEPNYHATKFVTENLLAIEIKKTEILMNKPVHLGLSKLELRKILMNGFFYDYVKPKHGKKAKLCYMDTDDFIVYIKTDDIYKNIAEDFETRLDTSSYKLDRTLPKGKDKKLIGLMKDKLGGKIITKFVGLRAKTCSYLIGDSSEDKKAKSTKKCVIKKHIFESYKNCLEAT